MKSRGDIHFKLARCRSPCGERGLKYSFVEYYKGGKWSLPLRGAWIEIGSGCGISAAYAWSLPLRGAWIEMGMPSW